METIALTCVLAASLAVSALSGFACYRRRRFFSYPCGLVQLVGGCVAAVCAMILSDTSLAAGADFATRSVSMTEALAYPVYLVSTVMILVGGLQAAGRGCLGLFCRYSGEDDSAGWRG